MVRIPLTLPELGLADAPIAVSQWLVEPEGRVTAGDRLVEVLAEGVTVDLASPASGRLVEILCDEDQQVRPGNILGWIESEEEPDDLARG